MSSWLAAVEANEVPFGLQAVPDHGGYDIIHVVRDPLKVVSSLERGLFFPGVACNLLRFARRYCSVTSLNSIGQSVEWFNEWTALCNKAASHTVLLEQVDDFLNKEYPARNPSLGDNPPKNLNSWNVKGVLISRRALVQSCTAASLKEFDRIKEVHGYN